MNRSKIFMLSAAGVVFCAILGKTIYDWVNFHQLEGGSIFFIFLSLSFFFNILKWGNHEGRGEKNDADKHIELKSAQISYFVIMVLSGLILFISEGTGDLNEINNLPLLTVVGLTFVLLPITELIYSRKYK
ncbi:hypothetical protein VBD025_14555 [Virgibacillus flavescens]|uniref:hypothetical protein n=1 Tax=Virgibacillus flavescens TaxID=1611422 RepID=UPI003D333B92